MMTEFAIPLVLTSPRIRGERVKDAQYLLGGANVFKQDFAPGPADGEYGPTSAGAAHRAKWFLGYPRRRCDKVFGQKLYELLTGKRKLTALERARRNARLKAAEKHGAIKRKALALARVEAGKHVTESPAGSNLQPYGAWYGWNGVAWCAIFFSWCNVHAGDRVAFKRGSFSASCEEIWGAARGGSRHLSFTRDPQAGDAAIYSFDRSNPYDHIGRFSRWIDKRTGVFEAIEGNTSFGSDSNGGAVMVRQRSTSDLAVPGVFVRLGA
jgi:hypothetical protein